MSTTSSSQPGDAARGGGRHERIGDALIASYLRELLEAEPAAAEPQLDLPTAPPAPDPLEDAELTA